ncbi:MAG TPA: hypothetical protein VIU43_07775, partial [Nitrosospira sp.]
GCIGAALGLYWGWRGTSIYGVALLIRHLLGMLAALALTSPQPIGRVSNERLISTYLFRRIFVQSQPGQRQAGKRLAGINPATAG